VADFIGTVNLIEGRVAATDADGAVVEAVGGDRLRVANTGGAGTGDTVWIAVRPEKIAISALPDGQPAEGLCGEVVEIGYRGDTSVYLVRLDSGLVLKAAAANTTRRARHAIGANTRVTLRWAPESAVVLTR
jgi:putrescine transport system ATP-binding protein